MEKLKKTLETLIPAISALGVIAVFLYIVVMLTIFPNKEIPNRDILLILLGILSSAFKDLISYWYGSSAGSKAKTDLMSTSKPL